MGLVRMGDPQLPLLPLKRARTTFLSSHSLLESQTRLEFLVVCSRPLIQHHTLSLPPSPPPALEPDTPTTMKLSTLLAFISPLLLSLGALAQVAENQSAGASRKKTQRPRSAFALATWLTPVASFPSWLVAREAGELQD